MVRTQLLSRINAMFNFTHSPMSACCEKLLRRSHFFDSTFSTNFVTIGVCNLFVRMSAICSFVPTHLHSITSLSTYSRVHFKVNVNMFSTPSESDVKPLGWYRGCYRTKGFSICPSFQFVNEARLNRLYVQRGLLNFEISLLPKTVKFFLHGLTPFVYIRCG